MPDSSAGTVAFLNGGEIVNDGRTIAYLENGFGPGAVRIDGGCVCPNIRELIDCGGAPYKAPALDPAPWYDSSIPESADFAGFLTHEFTGLGSTYTRQKTDKISGGAILGRLRPQARTLVWKGYLFGKSECAVQYGLQWLTSNLVGTGCDCGGEDLDIMICCPDLISTPPVSGCDGSAIHRPLNCPPFDQPDAFRTIKNVGLIDGPKILSQRKVGCCSTAGCSSCGGESSLIIEVEFSLICGNPYLYGCEVCLGANQPFPVVDETNCQWRKITPAEQAAILAERLTRGDTNTIICPADTCNPQPDCTVDPFCNTATLPPSPTFLDKCFCDPLVPTEICFSVPSNSFSAFFDGVPVIEIFSGDRPMRATTIRFFQNPKDLPCCTVGADPCLNCASMQIRYIPASSTMVIDGQTRQVTIQCPGATVPEIADHLVGTFAWPVLSCMDFCICIETEGIAISPSANVSVTVVPREM